MKNNLVLFLVDHCFYSVMWSLRGYYYSASVYLVTVFIVTEAYIINVILRLWSLWKDLFKPLEHLFRVNLV